MMRCSAPSMAVRSSAVSRSGVGGCARPANAGAPQLRRVAARAQQPGEDSGRSENVDWDAAWSSYKQRTDSDADQPGAGGAGPRASTRTTTRPSQSFTFGANRAPINPQAQAQLRAQERLLVDAWSSSWFQGAGAVLAVALLVAVLVGAGPPPTDARCTLPWC